MSATQGNPTMMILGFTGTRQGMTDAQRQTVNRLISELQPSEAHHGDCVGSDAEFHDLVAQNLPNTRIIIHPPLKDKWRAFRQGNAERSPLNYIARNHRIVDESTLMLATPQEMNEQQRSGTWATIRYAMKQGKPILVIAPDGTVKSHNDENKESTLNGLFEEANGGDTEIP